MNQEEQEKQHPCKEAQFVNDNGPALIEKVNSVMPLADFLRSKDMIHEEKYSEIKAGKTKQDKMRTLFEALHAGGDEVKTAFYQELRKHEPYLFMDLGGENRKRKLSDSECQIETKYKKPNTENERQINNNFSFVTPAPQYNVTPIVQEQKPVPTTVFLNSPIKPPPPEFLAIKTERKTPALKKKTPATKKEKKPPATKKEKKATATQKEKKPPATKREKKPPVPRKEKKPPAPKKEKKPPAPQKEKKPPTPKKARKTPAPKKVKKPSAPKKVRKPPAPKKVKKPSAPKKVRKPPHPKR